MLPPALMAYREREEGGFLGGFPVGGCAGVAALFTSFSLSILGPSIPAVFAAAGSGSRSLAIPCSCMLACVCGHTTCSFCALGLVVCVFGGDGVLSGGMWLPSLDFAGLGALHTIAISR